MLPASRIVHVAYAWSVNGTRELVSLRTGRPDSEAVRTCAGHFVHEECLYSSAISEYEILITNDTISLPSGEAALYPRIVARANNTAVTRETIEEFDLQYSGNTGGQFDVTRTTLAV